MKWLKLFFKPPFKDIIELAKENEMLKREVSNLWHYIYNRVQKEKNDCDYLTTPMHKKHNFDYIVNQIDELIIENKKLKEELISKMNYEQKREIHSQNK